MNWKKMYLKMVAASEDALEYLERNEIESAITVLTEAELECEEMYINADVE